MAENKYRIDCSCIMVVPMNPEEMEVVQENVSRFMEKSGEPGVWTRKDSRSEKEKRLDMWLHAEPVRWKWLIHAFRWLWQNKAAVQDWLVVLSTVAVGMAVYGALVLLLVAA